MSLTFSRRSFLKYTAVAAVAVAGSSLLTGCKDNPYQPTGTIGSKLTIMGDFTLLADPAPTYSASDKKFACNLLIKCTSNRNLYVTPDCFKVEVVYKDSNDKEVKNTYYSKQAENNNVNLSKSEPKLVKNDSLETQLRVGGIEIPDGATVNVIYWPRAQSSEGLLGYTEAYATWTMKYNAAKAVFEKV